MSFDWMDRAACRGKDPALFFPVQPSGPKGDRPDVTAPARVICATCPVSGPCLAMALDGADDTVGIWAGTTVADRKRILRDRRQRRRGAA